jgi:Putative transposase
LRNFRYKDYRRDGQARYRTMTLTPGEFIRRFLLHVLPKGFYRIRHYGLLGLQGQHRARQGADGPQCRRSIRRQRMTQPVRTPRLIIARRALRVAAA